MTTVATTNTPRAFASCESCYAAGRLVGVWIDAVDAADTTAEQIHAGSGVDPVAEGCEEFVCMDTDNMPTTGEPSLEEAARWGEIYEEVGDEQWSALCAWVRSGSYIAEGDTDFPCVSDFEEAYAGCWDSFRDYAFELAEDIGLFEGLDSEHVAVRYFDWDSWIRDLEMDHSVERDGHGGVYIFRSL
ncbi:antirestriction protein ArdA [Gordonia desulfuricans]|uniref:Antirestriction protein ArdA n=1 Tax=Gordonia desulfuricans TaxID=89051 RepID=A0A7K3LQ74_9ACTN|nr:antirestriction protein ArdA [Gordonia desulfuricans]NDK90424.1 antirestriction protein ArdA [Gordonia desulfuricans]